MRKFLKRHLPSISFTFFIISNSLSASSVGEPSVVLEHSTYTQETLSIIEEGLPKNTHVLKFGRDASPVKKSLIYGPNSSGKADLCYSTVTMLHPYNPIDGERISCGIAAIPLVASFSPTFKNNLPPSIQQLLNDTKIQDADLKIFFYAQNFPWEGGILICLRPHYATEPEAPTVGLKRAIERQITAGVFNTREGSVALEGQCNTLRTDSISTHPDADSLTILSPNNLHVTGLGSQKGKSFWSYVGYNNSGKPSAIVTLHSILTDDEYKALSGALQSTFGEYPENPIEQNISDLILAAKDTLPSFEEGLRLIAEYLGR